MKEKQIISVCMVIGLMLLGTGFLLGKNLSSKVKVQNVFPEKYHTEDMPSVNGNPKCITIVFADSVDGRPTFYVEFPDSTGLDSMYPEEIANGLNTGKWDYNEMLKLVEEE
jgi:hypothetical protein